MHTLIMMRRASFLAVVSVTLSGCVVGQSIDLSYEAEKVASQQQAAVAVEVEDRRPYDKVE